MLSAATGRSVVAARRVVNKRASTTRPQQQKRLGSDMPVPQSQNAPLWHGHSVQKEGWEESMYFYYAVGAILQAAVLLAAPETSIESWARPEAQARLYLKSKNPDVELEFGKHYQDVVEAEHLELWSKFAARAVTPGEDDDDDEDEEDEVRRMFGGIYISVDCMLQYECAT